MGRFFGKSRFSERIHQGLPFHLSDGNLLEHRKEKPLVVDIHTQHPTAEQLRAFILGKLTAEEHDRVEEHVGGCDSCCEALGSIPDDTLINQVKNADTSIAETLASVGAQTRTETNDCVPGDLASHSRYRVVRQLGRGGMGTVYEAEHRMMQRTVALKVINHQLVRNRNAIERFRGEVRAAAQLAHPNIVTAHDADEAGSLHFLVMEFVDGINLAKQVEKTGPLPIRHACHFARQVALGLEHAHERGMVHRDIKPQNLMLTRQGRVKILDFGLARFASEADADSESAKLTKEGVTLGTPDYIAPEQVLDSRKADIRADVYSLGCTLYFMLAGKPPFSVGTAIDKMKAHLEQAPADIGRTRSDIPVELTKIITRMMAKKPTDRFQSPGEVAAALQPFCQVPTAPAAPPVAISGVAEETDPLGLGNESLPSADPMSAYAPQLTRNNGPVSRKAIIVAVAATAIALVSVGGWFSLGAMFRGGELSDTQDAGAGEDTSSPRPTTFPVAEGFRVLIVLPFRDFWAPDYYGVRGPLDAAGVHVDVASSQLGQATPSEGGGSVEVSVLVSQANPDDYDAVIFSGAYPFSSLEFLHTEHDQARRLINGMLTRDRYVTAICGGTAVLAESGVLDGHIAAANEYLPIEIRARSAVAWSDQQPTQSFGHIITARRDKDGGQLVCELLVAFSKNR